jgi:hypothetical protein
VVAAATKTTKATRIEEEAELKSLHDAVTATTSTKPKESADNESTAR